MSNPEEVEDFKNIIANLITNAQLDALDKFEVALYRIARLPWWKRWQASDIAAEVLGIGKYSPHLKKRPHDHRS